MNADQKINWLAHHYGMTRKQVLDTLKQMSANPEFMKEFNKNLKK